MTTTKKPPTLAALRKLAERKGYGFVNVHRFPQEDGDKRTFFFATSSEFWGSTTLNITSGRRVVVYRLLFAALSALPDKPKKARK